MNSISPWLTNCSGVLQTQLGQHSESFAQHHSPPENLHLCKYVDALNCECQAVTKRLALHLQDTVPSDTSIIPTLLHSNNKATGAPLTDL